MSQPAQQQEVPGIQSKMTPVPDCGEESYKGSGKLTGKVAVITGGDSGIGRAVAIAYAREGADVLISYLIEDSDAKDTQRYVEQAGRRGALVKATDPGAGPGGPATGQGRRCRSAALPGDHSDGRR